MGCCSLHGFTRSQDVPVVFFRLQEKNIKKKAGTHIKKLLPQKFLQCVYIYIYIYI